MNLKYLASERRNAPTVEGITEQGMTVATQSVDLKDAFLRLEGVQEDFAHIAPDILRALPKEVANFQYLRLRSAYVPRAQFRGLVSSFAATILGVIAILGSDERLPVVGRLGSGSSDRWMAIYYLSLVVATFISFCAAAFLAKYLKSWTSRTARQVQQAEAILFAAVVIEAKGFLSAIVNRRLQATRDTLSLTTTDAPRLVEMNADDIVESESVALIREFLKEHDTSAIGVSGSRGVGKTTIIRSVCTSEGAAQLGVHVQSPVQYEADEFLGLLYMETAKKILVDAKARVHHERTRSRTLFVRALAGAILMVVGMLIILFEHASSTVHLSNADL